MKPSDSFNQVYTINEETYNGFISIFQDNNILHTDNDFAISKGFKSKIMHGNILSGFISHFVGECLPLKNVIIHSQSLNFYNPFYLFDILNLEVNITDYFESISTFELKFKFINQEGQKIATGKLTIVII